MVEGCTARVVVKVREERHDAANTESGNARCSQKQTGEVTCNIFPRRFLVAGPRMRGSHVGPGTFGCGRLGMLFMAFRFLQRKTMGKKKKKKKHHGSNQHHGERGNNECFEHAATSHITPTTNTLRGWAVLLTRQSTVGGKVNGNRCPLSPLMNVVIDSRRECRECNRVFSYAYVQQGSTATARRELCSRGGG